MSTRKLLTCCLDNRGHAPRLNLIVGAQNGSSQRAGPGLRAHPGLPNTLIPDPAPGLNLGLAQGVTRTDATAGHDLVLTPTGGSLALVPTAPNTAASRARAIPLCRAGGVTLAAEAMTTQKKHTVMAVMLMLGQTLTPAHVWGCLV